MAAKNNLNNEGIDVEKEALVIAQNSIRSTVSLRQIRTEIESLVARVRAETEAAVTKRERKAFCNELSDLIVNNQDAEDLELLRMIVRWNDTKLKAAYESNDAGGKP
jgi:uncharacterized protein YaiI (UPF0178 family)